MTAGPADPRPRIAARSVAGRRARAAGAAVPRGLALLALATLAACAGPPSWPTPFGRADRVLASAPHPQRSRGLPVAESTPAGAELAFVSAILADLQRRSFAGNREFCGYIGLDAAGALMQTAPIPGNEASCPLPDVPPGMTLLASFHTHGTYSPYYASEWPTTQDMATDASDDIDGYISTPGGRLWHVDTDRMAVDQVCGRGCLPQDPAYVAADDGPVRPAMTYAELAAWERS